MSAAVRALRLIAPILALVVALCGCNGSTSSSGAGASVDRIKQDIAAVSFTDEASLRHLAADAGSANALQAAKDVLASSAPDSQTWAAVYLYLGAGDDPAPLHPLLTAKALDIRAMAAAGAVSDGDAAGFPVLIALLGEDSIMRGSMPLQPFWRFAALTLVSVTGDATRGPASDAVPSQVAAAQKRWQAWWSANSAKLHWDAGQRLWVTS